MPIRTSASPGVIAPSRGVVRVMLRKRLQAMSATLRAQIARDVRDLATELAARGEDATPSQHPADVAGDLELRELILSDELMRVAELREVQDALRRMNQGTYGRCVDCGSAIPADRLEARPQAARDVKCARVVEPRLH